MDIPPLQQSVHIVDKDQQAADLQLTGLKRKKSGNARVQLCR